MRKEAYWITLRRRRLTISGGGLAVWRLGTILARGWVLPVRGTLGGWLPIRGILGRGRLPISGILRRGWLSVGGILWRGRLSRGGIEGRRLLSVWRILGGILLVLARLARLAVRGRLVLAGRRGTTRRGARRSASRGLLITVVRLLVRRLARCLTGSSGRRVLIWRARVRRALGISGRRTTRRRGPWRRGTVALWGLLAVVGWLRAHGAVQSRSTG
jgi:hypothetical protein